MKQLTEFKTPFLDWAEQSRQSANEPEWLQSLRKQAAGVFERHGLPAKKVEDWKYTSLWALSQQHLVQQRQTVSLSKQQVEDIALLSNSYRVVILDGQFDAELSLLDDLEQGLTIQALSASFSELEPALNQQIDMDTPGLNALNTMLMNEGVYVHVAGQHHIAKPLEVLVISTSNNAALSSHLRHIVQMQNGAELTLVEHYVSVGEVAGLTNVISEVNLQDNATLNHFKLQHESLDQHHIAHLAAKQSHSSHWNTCNISLGAKLARNDVHTQLLGEHAHVTMDGLYLVAGQQHVDNHTAIEHMVPNTTSQVNYKGVIDDESHAVFNGKVKVYKHAQKTDSSQSNRNLLLSRECEIDSKPELEIYADDVKCAHGSTVGQLDEQHLFFLRARGLDETTARSLLTFGFAIDVLQSISDEPIRQAMSQVVEQRLPRGA